MNKRNDSRVSKKSIVREIVEGYLEELPDADLLHPTHWHRIVKLIRKHLMEASRIESETAVSLGDAALLFRMWLHKNQEYYLLR